MPCDPRSTSAAEDIANLQGAWRQYFHEADGIENPPEEYDAGGITTISGTTFTFGSIAVGKNADLILVTGDPSATIGDIENVTTVFKDGVGYDSAKLMASVKGIVGRQ